MIGCDMNPADISLRFLALPIGCVIVAYEMIITLHVGPFKKIQIYYIGHYIRSLCYISSASTFEIMLPAVIETSSHT